MFIWKREDFKDVGRIFLKFRWRFSRDSLFKRVLYSNILEHLSLDCCYRCCIHCNLNHKKKAKRFERLKNLQLVEEYFQNISKRILEAEEKLPYLKLTMSYKDVEERFNNVTLNFTYLKEYYDGIKKSYSESELKTFLNIYRIIKNDLDFIEEVLKNSETILKKRLKEKKRLTESLRLLKISRI